MLSKQILSSLFPYSGDSYIKKKIYHKWKNYCVEIGEYHLTIYCETVLLTEFIEKTRKMIVCFYNLIPL